jgi:hypothetical protein
VTGGSDHKVCIWNLLPAISIKYEKPAGANILSSVESANANMSVIEEKKHEDEDSNMVSEFITNLRFRTVMSILSLNSMEI